MVYLRTKAHVENLSAKQQVYFWSGDIAHVTRITVLDKLNINIMTITIKY